MAYAGYLLKIGKTEFPMQYILEETYRATPKQRLELDAYRDNLGELHREVAGNRPSRLEFNLIGGLTNSEVAQLMAIISGSYINEAERKVMVTYYMPATDTYSEPEAMYLPDIEYPIDYITGNIVYYNSITLRFIGY